MAAAYVVTELIEVLARVLCLQCDACPPESGGQRDCKAITRGLVPQAALLQDFASEPPQRFALLRNESIHTSVFGTSRGRRLRLLYLQSPVSYPTAWIEVLNCLYDLGNADANRNWNGPING